MSFFSVPGPPWTPKPRKTRGFLIVPRWISGTPRATKHRKTRCFLTPWAEYTVNYKGSGEPEVSPRSPPWGRRLGRLASITFGYQPKASGKGTGWPSWPAPGLKGYRPCRRPLVQKCVKLKPDIACFFRESCVSWLVCGCCHYFPFTSLLDWFWRFALSRLLFPCFWCNIGRTVVLHGDTESNKAHGNEV